MGEGAEVGAPVGAPAGVGAAGGGQVFGGDEAGSLQAEAWGAGSLHALWADPPRPPLLAGSPAGVLPGGRCTAPEVKGMDAPRAPKME